MAKNSIKKSFHLIFQPTFVNPYFELATQYNPSSIKGVNFVNVLSAPFSYKHLFGSFFSSYMYVEKSCTKHFQTKNARVKCWWNWHKGSAANSIKLWICQKQIKFVLSTCKWYNGALHYCRKHHDSFKPAFNVTKNNIQK